MRHAIWWLIKWWFICWVVYELVPALFRAAGYPAPWSTAASG